MLVLRLLCVFSSHTWRPSTHGVRTHMVFPHPWRCLTLPVTLLLRSLWPLLWCFLLRFFLGPLLIPVMELMHFSCHLLSPTLLLSLLLLDVVLFFCLPLPMEWGGLMMLLLPQLWGEVHQALVPLELVLYILLITILLPLDLVMMQPLHPFSCGLVLIPVKVVRLLPPCTLISLQKLIPFLLISLLRMQKLILLLLLLLQRIHFLSLVVYTPCLQIPFPVW